MALYSIKLYIGIVILIKSVSSTKVPSIFVEHFLNGAQILNITCVAASTDFFLWGWGPAGEPAGTAIILVTVIFPVTEIYASEKSQRLDSIDFDKNFVGLGCKELPFDSLSITYNFLVANLSFHCQNHSANLEFFALQLFIRLWQNFVKN